MSRRSVAVAAPNAIAARAGTALGAAGGNAVDVAVAAVVAAAVTEPGIVSPMGGAFVNIWPAHGHPLVIDGNVEMPGRDREPSQLGFGLERIDMEYGGGITVHGGHGSVATPGFFAAMSHASSEFGGLPWADLLRPAIEAARDGYELGRAAAYYLSLSGGLFLFDPDTRAYLCQGEPEPQIVPGRLMRSEQLAASLETIAADGAQTLYTGDLAAVIAEDMADHGGLLSLTDLAAYRTVVRTPLRHRLGRWDVAVNPPPSIGGPVLLAMLQLLSRSARTPADIIETERIVLGYRRRHLDLASDLQGAGEELLRVLADEDPRRFAALSASPDTVHVSAVDSDGLACSITTSAGYGAGITTPGTGLMLNNALGEPELNRLGVHAMPPGSRLPSNMAPTTARSDDGGVLAVGTPGADRITTALLQVLNAFCVDEESLAQAIEHPRLHVAYDANGRAHLEHEDGPGLREAARDSGLPWRTHEEISMYFGGVAGALRTVDGTLHAAADPRREGGTGVS